MNSPSLISLLEQIIEKEPLFHFLPGSFSDSIAAIVSNFKCGSCQNWQISQTINIAPVRESNHFPPEAVVEEARRSGCASIAHTYTEPTIFFEYAYQTAKLVKQAVQRNVAAAETICPACGEAVIKRAAGGLQRKKIAAGHCNHCDGEIGGGCGIEMQILGVVIPNKADFDCCWRQDIQ